MRPSKARRALAALCLSVLAVSAASANAAPASVPTAFFPNDPIYTSMSRQSAELVNLPQAWLATLGSPSVPIAIIDSGVTPNPDINLMPGFNAIDGSGNTVDGNGHGTAMAGIAAAVINNGIGGAGSCGKCVVLPIKIAGDNDRHTNAWLASGINSAVARGARVLNLSRFSPPDPLVNSAVTNAINAGGVVVIGAGNFSSDNPAVNALASNNPQAIRVAAVDDYGELESFSDFGSWVDIAAPDHYFFGVGSIIPSGGQTSGATALVSGIVGLMRSFNPQMSPARVKECLMSSGKPVVHAPAQGPTKIVDALGALECAGYTPPPSQFTVTVGLKGKGKVVRTPAGTACGKNCGQYAQGTSVKLAAKPQNSKLWKFAGWKGACRGKRTTCTLKVQGDTSVNATFVKRKK